MLRHLLVFALLLLAAAEINLEVHTCLDMQVTNTESGDIQFSVSFAKQQFGVELVPVLGFEAYNDALLEQRGSCGNIARGTTADRLAEALANNEISVVAQNGWVRSLQDDVVTFRLTKTLEELGECHDYFHEPVVYSRSGTFYIALVQITEDDGDLLDYARYVQPHEFRLDADGNVVHVTGMQFQFDIEWVGNFWNPTGEVLVQLESRVVPLGTREGHFSQAEVITESGEPLALTTITGCDPDVTNACVQSWYLRGGGEQGTYRLGAQLSEESGPSLLMTAIMQLDLQHGEVHPDQSGVEAMIFRDEDLTLPYVASALNAENLIDGATVCMMLQDSSGNDVSARAARICTSMDMDLTASSGSTSGGCNTPDATNVIQANIFDKDSDEESTTFNPIIRRLQSASQQAFCFTAKKLSNRSHVLEVEYYGASLSARQNGKRDLRWSEWDGQKGERKLLSFEWDDRKRCPRDMWIDCPSDCDWNRGHSSCQKKHSQTDDDFGAGWIVFWVFFVICLIIICIAAFCGTGYDDGWYHPSWGGWGQDGTNNHNSNNTYNVHHGNTTTQTYQKAKYQKGDNAYSYNDGRTYRNRQEGDDAEWDSQQGDRAFRTQAEVNTPAKIDPKDVDDMRLRRGEALPTQGN